MAGHDSQIGLCDLLDRLLDTGAVIRGSIIVSVADVDLIYLELAVVVAAADRIFEKAGNALRNPA